MDKENEYRKLVDEIKSCPKLDKQTGSIPSECCNTDNARVKLCRCPENNFNEVNLWTYWQGKGNRNPNILLVGQDWGKYDPNEPTIQNVRDEKFYLYGDKSKTDMNLIKLFGIIGYQIGTKSTDKKLKDLFFTNLVACYRTDGLTGNFRQRWITNCAPYMERLIHILEPRIIICLGRRTYDGICSIYGNKASAKISYNSILDDFESDKMQPVYTGQYEDNERINRACCSSGSPGVQ